MQSARAASKLSSTMHRVMEYAAKPQNGVTLQELLEFGSDITTAKLIHSAKFLHYEMPIRYAHRVKDLDTLPYGLCQMPSVQQVKKWYIQSMEELLEFPKVQTAADERRFTAMIESIKERHNATLFTMARGVHELKLTMHEAEKKGNLPISMADMIDLHSFLDGFYLSRIGIRMLMGQHIALRQKEEGWVGCICEATSPAEVALAAVDTARHMCIRQYGDAPDVEFHGDTNFTMPYVPSHLHHMLFEVMKNSMRAVVEFHGVDNALPAIKLIVADGDNNEDVSIKISDEGGGIPRSALPRIWSYMYTTANSHVFESMIGESVPMDFGGESPLAGLGYGLPISRLFARYFGGDLQIISMEGYGTDAYLHLRRVGDASEPLP
ncbi:pyruvate dehydrogenase kinase [Thraustotheca clavata]|uniref:Protein-serine/threonine kinase n=1 Tax=Thraustotheca clavata TaxID=74557 RepID=A0A1W0A3E4_9STRA|nr:pyruvate dehydrogenase kinase [Thraustotheca clavata]